MTTVSYREAPESFTWELRWDGRPPRGTEELAPPRSEGDPAGAWAPVVKVSRVPGGARFAVRVRHAARVHDLDAPQGPRYDGVFVLALRGAAGGDWARLDRRPLPHLSPPKDTLDTFDVVWKVKASAEGETVGPLLVQGAHGPAGRQKKPKKAKAGARPGKGGPKAGGAEAPGPP